MSATVAIAAGGGGPLGHATADRRPADRAVDGRGAVTPEASRREVADARAG